MTSIISIANVAAGVGKTTLAVSLAVELALRGYKTLLIDADPQAVASEYFFNPRNVKYSLADVLCLNRNFNNSESSSIPTSLYNVIISTRVHLLDIVLSTIRLAAFESGIFIKDSHFVLNRLKSQLEELELEEAYDFVIIDTPSSLGQITTACLRASTHVIVPAAPTKPSVKGLHLISERIRDMPRYSDTANFGVMPCINERIELLGIVFNHFDCQRPMSGTVFNELKSEWKGQCFDTALHRDSLIESCLERHQIFQVDHPRSQPATLFAELTDEIVRRIALPLDVPAMRNGLEAR